MVLLARLILLLYPPSFRRRYGPEILELIEFRSRGGTTETGRRQPRGGAWYLVLDTAKALPSAYAELFLKRFKIQREVLLSRRLSFVERMRIVLSDVRFAVRNLVRTPGFTIVAVVTLALGIGANTAIFSIVNGVLLRPLPFPNPDMMAMISATDLETGSTGGSMSQPDIRDIQTDAETIAAAAGYSTTSFTLTDRAEPELIRGARVTDGLLAVIEKPPLLGRDIRAEENVPNGPRVAVISHAVWVERFGSDPNVLGRTIDLSETPYEIVGVAPEGVDYPDGAQIWVPRYLNTNGCGRDCHFYRVIARLAPNVDINAARMELTALATRLEQTYPELNHRKSFGIVPLGEAVYGDAKAGLLVLLGAVGIVLLIACANVANLLLVRGTARSGEVAVRSALGAGRGRLISQMMVEALVLAAAGGALGVALAHWTLPLLLALAPTLPRADAIGLSVTVLAAAAGLVLLVTIAFGLLPALRVSGISVAGTLSRSGRGAPGARGQDRSRSLLLAAEVALSLLLLTGAGLFLRSFSELQSVQLGFDRQDVVKFTLGLPRARYDTEEQAIRFFQDLNETLTQLHQVETAGATFGSPLGNTSISASTILLDRPRPPEGQEDDALIRVITPGYLEALRVPLLQGRLFDRSDNLNGQRVAIVSKAFADKYYGDDSPIGKELELGVGFGLEETSRTIVGVVGDIRSRRITRSPVPEVYAPHAQMAGGYLTVVARMAPGTRDPMAIIKQTVNAVDPMLPLRGAETLEDSVNRELGPTKIYLALLALFAGLAVAIAVVGLYGVVAYLISRRTREIGIRIALGAGIADVTRLVLSQGVRPVVIGIVLGLIGCFWSTRLLGSLLYNVQPLDVFTLVGTTTLLVVVAGLAIVLPAKRATRISPTEALRAE